MALAPLARLKQHISLKLCAATRRSFYHREYVCRRHQWRACKIGLSAASLRAATLPGVTLAMCFGGSRVVVVYIDFICNRPHAPLKTGRFIVATRNVNASRAFIIWAGMAYAPASACGHVERRRDRLESRGNRNVS